MSAPALKRASEHPGELAPADDSPSLTPAKAIEEHALGVHDAKHAPVLQDTLATGDVVGGRFEVTRFLGSSDGAISYLCHDRRGEAEAVLKVIAYALDDATRAEFSAKVRTAAGLDPSRLTRLIGMGQIDSGHIFVAMEFVDGMSLGRFVSNRRARGLHPTIRDVFTVSAHLCDVLTVVHREMAHGVVTPYNVMITRKGLVKLSNLAFGELTARLLAPQLKGPFYDSIYVAPELATDSSALTPACDVYSLGMLAISLLTEHPVPGDRVSAEPVISATMESLPPHLTQLLIESLSLDPSHRPSLKEFRAVFEDAARDMGAVLGAPPAADELPIIAAVSADSDLVDEQDDPFADLDLGDLSGIGFDTGDEGRYLVQKGGLDYGPYTEEEVLEQLYRDEIDEYTLVVDRETDERMALEHTSAFTEAVRAYVPKREERRRIEAERRAELQRKVKKGGVAGLVVACVVGAVTAIAMIVVIALQPDPEPLPMDQAFASLDQFKLLPPPKDFETLAVDQGEIQKIFDPRASESELRARLKRFKKKRGRQRAGSGLPGGDNVTTVDFGAGGSKHVLTDDEVYAEIMGKFPALRRCVLKELNADSGFKGVTVQFFIRPSGTTGGVKIKESAYAGRPVGQCLVSRFRGMKFPEHGGFNKGVVFPLRVQ